MARNLLPGNSYPCSSLYPRPTTRATNLYPRPTLRLPVSVLLSTYAQLSTLNSLSTLDSLQCYHRFPIHAHSYKCESRCVEGRPQRLLRHSFYDYRDVKHGDPYRSLASCQSAG